MAKNQQSPQYSKKPGKTKRQIVNPGDIVQMAGYLANNDFGTVAIVQQSLDKDRVIVRAVAPRDDSLEDQDIIIVNYKPTGTHPSGNEYEYCYTWIKKVIHRSVPLPPPPPKPAPKVKKITTTEELAEVIQKGKDKGDLIHVDLSGEAQGGSNANVRTNAGSTGKTRGRTKAN